MAWTDPVRYPNSMEITDSEAFLNTYVIDNLAYLKANSGGDTIYAATSTLKTTSLSSKPYIDNWSDIVTTGASSSAGNITITNSGTYAINASAYFENFNGLASDYINFKLSNASGSGFRSLNRIPFLVAGDMQTASLFSIETLTANSVLSISATSSNLNARWGATVYGTEHHSISIRKIA
jgi:hypothetical protein